MEAGNLKSKRWCFPVRDFMLLHVVPSSCVLTLPKGRHSSLGPFYKDTSLIMRVLFLHINYLQKASPPNTFTIKVRISPWIFRWKHTHTHPTTTTLHTQHTLLRTLKFPSAWWQLVALRVNIFLVDNQFPCLTLAIPAWLWSILEVGNLLMLGISGLPLLLSPAPCHESAQGQRTAFEPEYDGLNVNVPPKFLCCYSNIKVILIQGPGEIIRSWRLFWG